MAAELDKTIHMATESKIVHHRYSNQYAEASYSSSDRIFPGPCNLIPFARKIETPVRERGGRLCAPGSWVLSPLQSADVVVEYSRVNFTTPEYRDIWVASRFPVKELWSENQNFLYDSILLLKQNFSNRLECNFSKNVLMFKSFPEFKFSWTKLCITGPWPIGSVSTLTEDFTDILFNALIDDAKSVNNEGDLSVPDAWRNIIKATIFAKIFKISSFGFFPRSVYVVAVFATPLGLDDETGTYHFINPTARLLEIVKKCAAEALRGKPKSDFVFYSIGTGLSAVVEINASCDGNSTLALSSPRRMEESEPRKGTISWDVRRSGYLTGQPAYRDFCDRLMPITQDDIFSAIKFYVDEKFEKSKNDSFSVAKVNVDEIAEYLHNSESCNLKGFPRIRRTVVIRTLLQMQGNDPLRYVVCKDIKDPKDIFVISPDEFVSGKDKIYKMRGMLLNLLLYHSIEILGVIISVAIGFSRMYFLNWLGLSDSIIWIIIMVVMVTYISKLLQRRLNHMLSTLERD